MTDAWMIPNIPAMGGGGIVSTGSSGLSNAYQQAQANQAYYAQQQAALQAAQISQQQLYGPGGFGSQPAYYAGLGAAYGRSTGGFGGYGGQNDPFTPVTDEQRAAAYARDPSLMGPGADPDAARAAAYASNPSLIGPTAPSVFDTGTAPFNDYGGGANPGGFSPSPNYPGGTTDPDAARAAAYARDPSLMGPGAMTPQTPFDDYGGGANPGGFSPSPNYPGGSDPDAARAAAYARDPSLMGPGGETREQAYARDPSLMGPGGAPPLTSTGGSPGSMPTQPSTVADPDAARAAAYARDPSLMGPGGISSYPQGVQAFDPDAARAAAYAADPRQRGPAAAPPAMGSLFDPATYSDTSFGSRYGAAPPVDPILQPGARLPAEIFGGGFHPTPPYQPTDFNSRYNAAPAYDPSSFANRFGAGGYYQPGTPSQYYTGSQYPNAQAPPPGYETPYSFDNPDGALPVRYYDNYMPGGA